MAHGSLRVDDPRLAEGRAAARARPARRHRPAAPRREPRTAGPGRPGGDPVAGRRASRRARGRAAHRVGALGRRVRRARADVPDLAPGAASTRSPRSTASRTSTTSSAPPSADCRKELLTAQPAGRRKATTLAVAEERDVKALERGVKMRTLYQHPARHSPATRSYVADIVARGAEVRTLDEFFKRLIVFDRKLAIIPGPAGNEMAVAIRDRSLIAYLVDIFERSWERAQPFSLSGNQAERNIAADVRAMTHPAARRGPQRPGERQAAGGQHPHLRRLHRRAQGRVRRADPLPARLRHGRRRRDPSVPTTPRRSTRTASTTGSTTSSTAEPASGRRTRADHQR